MIDCHIHGVLSGSDWRASIAAHKEKPDRKILEGYLSDYQKKGYTYLRDGGDRWGVCYAARELAGRYVITYKAPGAPLYRKGHYGAFIGRGFETLSEYADLVRQKRREGADFLKIMISGLMDFNAFGLLSEASLEPAMIREMVHIGREEGFSVMAHANGTETVMAAAEAGVSSVEHGAYLHTEALCAMAERGTVWVPTLSPVGNLLETDRYDPSTLAKIMENFQENLLRFAGMGGRIAAGSDAGAYHVPHACGSEGIWLEKTFGENWQTVTEQGNAAIMEMF